jgi:hypothetical protein
VLDAHFDGARHLRSSDDRAWWLGDAIPIRELDHIMTFGDLIVLAGVVSVAANMTRRTRLQPLDLSSEARAGLVSIAPPELRLDDEPVIDLALLAEAANFGYASRVDEPSPLPRHQEGEARPGLGDGTEAAPSVRVPVLGKP